MTAETLEAEEGRAWQLRARRVAGSIWFRLAVTAGLLGVVLVEVDWHTAARHFTADDWPWLAGAVATLELAFLVGALRWFRLLRGAEIDIAPGETLRAYMIGMFSNNFLPTGFGGDATRAIIVGRARSQLSRAGTSVIADRVASVACLVVIGWIALAADPGAVPTSLILGFLAVSVAGTLGAVVVAWLLVAGARHPLKDRLPRRVRASAREIRGTLAGYLRQPAVLTWTFLLGLVFQTLTVGATWLIARSLGIDLSFALLAVVAPVVLLATVLPISVAGFGVREGSYVVLLSAAGVSTTDATLLSLLTGASLAAASLVGAVALLLPGRDRTSRVRVS